MGRKTAGDRKTVRKVGGGPPACAAPSSTPREGAFLGVNLQRSRKEPEQSLLKTIPEDLLCAVPRAQARSWCRGKLLVPEGRQGRSAGLMSAVGAVSCGCNVSIGVWGAGVCKAMCWGQGGGSGGSQPPRGWDSCLTEGGRDIKRLQGIE